MAETLVCAVWRWRADLCGGRTCEWNFHPIGFMFWFICIGLERFAFENVFKWSNGGDIVKAFLYRLLRMMIDQRMWLINSVYFHFLAWHNTPSQCRYDWSDRRRWSRTSHRPSALSRHHQPRSSDIRERHMSRRVQMVVQRTGHLSKVKDSPQTQCQLPVLHHTKH